MNVSQETIKQEPERARREFWAITDWGTVERVTGFDCGPNYKGTVWWVPHLGYSMTLGAHIFELDQKEKAFDKAISEQEKLLAETKKKLNHLKQRLTGKSG